MRILPLLLLLAACSGGETEDSSTNDDTNVEDTDTAVAECVSEADSCTFNSDCPTDERCGCTETDGCVCECGERGTGVNGIDTCTDGNDCESSVCLEGPEDVYYCSGECTTDADCTGALPNCTYVTFMGMICIRDAPQP